MFFLLQSNKLPVHLSATGVQLRWFHLRRWRFVIFAPPPPSPPPRASLIASDTQRCVWTLDTKQLGNITPYLYNNTSIQVASMKIQTVAVSDRHYICCLKAAISWITNKAPYQALMASACHLLCVALPNWYTRLLNSHQLPPKTSITRAWLIIADNIHKLADDPRDIESEFCLQNRWFDCHRTRLSPVAISNWVVLILFSSANYGPLKCFRWEIIECSRCLLT